MPQQRDVGSFRGTTDYALGIVTDSGPDNPLQTATGSSWDRLIEAIGPASILLVIERRMSARLLREWSPDDVFQETLLRAWRDRERLEWRGLRSFRSWILSIAGHCILDLAERIGTQKRGGGRPPRRFSEMGGHGGFTTQGSVFAGPAVTTTPSRAAACLEEAARLKAAVDGLEDELREVVWLRLFEQMSWPQMARQLEVSESAARRRFHRGLRAYRDLLGLPSTAGGANPAS